MPKNSNVITRLSKRKNYCLGCGKEIQRASSNCSKCYNAKRKLKLDISFLFKGIKKIVLRLE